MNIPPRETNPNEMLNYEPRERERGNIPAGYYVPYVCTHIFLLHALLVFRINPVWTETRELQSLQEPQNESEGYCDWLGSVTNELLRRRTGGTMMNDG